jgi:hypothetical protein
MYVLHLLLYAKYLIINDQCLVYPGVFLHYSLYITLVTNYIYIYFIIYTLLDYRFY